MKNLLLFILLLPVFAGAQSYSNKPGDPRQLQVSADSIKLNSRVILPLHDSTNGYPGGKFGLYVKSADSLIRITNPPKGNDYESTNYITPEMFGVKANTGTDVSINMQAAINYASSRNRVLVLGPGTYIVKNLTLPSNANVSGQSLNTVLQLPGGNETDKQVFLINAGVSNVTLANFIIDANRAAQTGTNVVCLKVINTDSTAAHKISDLKFTGITFRNSKDRALIWFRGYRIENTTIENCVFTNAGVQAVELRGCKNFTFRNNTVTAWGLTTTAAPAFGLQSVINDGINIIGNFFINSVGGQFAIESAGAYVQNSSVTSNTFDGNSLPAAGISGYFRNTTFSGNKHIRGVGTQRTGYELIGNDLVVSGNYIENGAIVFTADEVNPVAEVRPNGRNCIISNNIIKTSATNASAIYLSGFVRNDTMSRVSNVTVSGNLIDNRGSTGNSATISVGFYGTAGLVSQVKIEDNKIYADASQACIRLRTYDTSNNLEIAGNEFLSGQYGIRIDQPAGWKNTEFSGNDFSKMSSGEYVFSTGTFTREFKVFHNIYGVGKRTAKTEEECIIVSGAGSPEGVITAAPGSLYLNINGGTGVTMYVKKTGTGNTGWQIMVPAQAPHRSVQPDIRGR